MLFAQVCVPVEVLFRVLFLENEPRLGESPFGVHVMGQGIRNYCFCNVVEHLSQEFEIFQSKTKNVELLLILLLCKSVNLRSKTGLATGEGSG